MSMVIESVIALSVDKLLTTITSLIPELQTSGSRHVPLIEDLNYVRRFLQDAEDRKEADRAISCWLKQLEDWICSSEDILEVLSYPELRSQVELAGASPGNIICWKTKNFLRSATTCWTRSSLTCKLNEIAKCLPGLKERIINLNLIEKPITIRSRLGYSRPESVSLPSEPAIFGRENEKSEIIRILLRHEEGEPRIGVIPIIGVGGLGKTTLARCVYDDDQVVSSFEVRGWICISENYEIIKITENIRRSISVNSFNMNGKSLDWIQGGLRDDLRNKKFLLVLEDLWNDNYGDWDVLKTPFMEGKAGSRIVVTTRNGDVAGIVGTVSSFQPGMLSDEECWSLLRLHAGLDSNRMSLFEETGKKIAEKCLGLPLAAKTMGGLLRNKMSLEEWESVLNCNCWMSNDIMRVLKMSYDDLDPQLKRCFAFLSLLPEDYEFREKEVVLIWVGAGLIQLQDEDERSEIEVARDCFHGLLSRSLISPSLSGSELRHEGISFYLYGGDFPKEQRFLMHYLIRDLAKEVSGGNGYMAKCGKMPESLKSTRHLSFHGSNLDNIVKSIVKQREAALCLRTFWAIDGDQPSSNSVNKMISRLIHVRALSLKFYDRYSFGSIGELILLRYLDLTDSNMRILPTAITSLYNLRVLILKGCSNLKRLPRRIGKLIHLCHLDISECYSLRELPEGIKELRKLQHLSTFIVGKKLPVSTLGGLNLLQESLEISDLQYTTSVDEARLARLCQKRLQYLSLDWGESDSDNGREEEILDQLRPHEDLEKLSINNYGGSRLSEWLTGGCLLTNLTALRLSYLEKCSLVLTFDALPSLKEVGIIGCPEIEVFLGAITKLKKLFIEGCKEVNCIEAFRIDALDVLVLRDIDIDRISSLFKHKIRMECGQVREIYFKENVFSCPLLFPYWEFSNVNLMPDDCNENMKVEMLSMENQCRLPPWLSNAESLKMLNVYNCPEVSEMPPQGSFPSALHDLNIRDCPLLFKKLPHVSDSLQSLSSLSIDSCCCDDLKAILGLRLPNLKRLELESSQMKTFPIPDTQILHSVGVLRLNRFDELKQISSFPLLDSLAELKVERCFKLEYFPEDGLPPSIKKLYIMECPLLEKKLLARDQKLCSKINHIPYITVDNVEFLL